MRCVAMELDALLLSRVQFGFVVAFHILFPAFTIGLASYIAVLEALWLKTGNEKYFAIANFWTRIFAVSFGMGVVSGIVMAYQFGTNWSRFADLTANVIGPLMGYEVLTAFFLEATFLGILLFGRNRVPRPVHFLSAVMVALGTLFSAFWILSANSWMQTPTGYEIIDGTFHVTSWVEAIFNPSFPYRFMHMVTACYLTTAFVVIGVSAHYLLKRRAVPEAKAMMWMGIGLIACLAPAQIVLGDLHGLNTFAFQPAKIAAMEGHWEAKEGAPLILFGIPDVEAEKNHWEVSIPLLGSVILTHEIRGAVPGLKDWAPEDRPYVPLVFASFRVMVGIGLLMVFVAVCGVVLRIRDSLYERRWFLRLCVACTPIGFIAVIAGWITTESGRQPWIVYDLMRTAEGVSPAITGSSVLTSLVTFFVAYAIIFSAGTYYILILIRRGPTPDVPEDTDRPLRTPQRPLSAADKRGTVRERGRVTIDLPLLWAGVIAFGVFMYVLMDGFDLGVGIIFPFARDERHRDIMMNSVAPIWDGNETWLVLGGTALLAAFPIAYATILPALYLPVLLMLIALIFRGVAFEFRFKTERHRGIWSWSFHLGSLLATFSQGIILGSFITGFEVVDRNYVGGMLDWLTPFTIATGLGMIAGYTLLGSTWIIMKTEGSLQAWAYRVARWALFLVLGFIALVSIWTPLEHEDIAERWFSWPNIVYLSPVPILTGLLALGLYVMLERRREVFPFVLSLGLFTLSYMGLAISLWPNVVPPDITIWDAAADPKTQVFLLVGVAIVVPIILIYTAYSYYVFRGKVRPDEGYH